MVLGPVYMTVHLFPFPCIHSFASERKKQRKIMIELSMYKVYDDIFFGMKQKNDSSMY